MGRRLLCAVVWVLVLSLYGLVSSGSAGAQSSGIPVQVIFSGHATVTIDQTYSASGGSCTTHDPGSLDWTATYNTVFSDGKLEDAKGTLSGMQASLNLSFGGICGGHLPDCSVSLTQSNPPIPSLTTSGSDPIHLEAQSFTAGVGGGGCDSRDGAFIGRDEAVLSTATQGEALRAVADIPASSLTSGLTVPVGDGTSPGHIESPCTDVPPVVAGNTECTATLNWSGTLQVQLRKCPGPKIQQVTLVDSDGSGRTLSASERQSYGIIDDNLHPGQTISTPNGVSLILSFDDSHPGQADNTQMSIAPNHELRIPLDCDDASVHPRGYNIDYVDFGNGTPNDNWWSWAPNDFSDGINWVITGLEAHVAFPGSGSRDASDAAATATPRIITFSRLGSGAGIVHLVSGGPITVRVGTGPSLTLEPGQSAQVTKHGVTATTLWPASAQRILPATKRPPKLSGLKITGASAAHRAHLRLRLDQPAKLTLIVRRGRRVLARRTVGAHRGANSVLLPKLSKGRDLLQVSAQQAGRVATASLRFTVR